MGGNPVNTIINLSIPSYFFHSVIFIILVLIAMCAFYRHIILCGYITEDSVENFLRDFLHEDRSDVTVNVVIMGK